MSWTSCRGPVSSLPLSHCGAAGYAFPHWNLRPRRWTRRMIGTTRLWSLIHAASECKLLRTQAPSLRTVASSRALLYWTMSAGIWSLANMCWPPWLASFSSFLLYSVIRHVVDCYFFWWDFGNVLGRLVPSQVSPRINPGMDRVRAE